MGTQWDLHLALLRDCHWEKSWGLLLVPCWGCHWDCCWGTGLAQMWVTDLGSQRVHLGLHWGFD